MTDQLHYLSWTGGKLVAGRQVGMGKREEGREGRREGGRERRKEQAR